MKKFFDRTVLFVLLFPLLTFPQQLLNLDIAKKNVKNYYESGRYLRQVDSILTEAKKEIASFKLSENAVAIFDIDDTALSNYEYTKSLGFGFTRKTWVAWVKAGKCKAINPVKEFYKFLKKKGVKIIFLTGRDSTLCKASKENLISEGFSKPDSIICKGKYFNDFPASQFKNEIRKQLTSAGFNIILTLGDQDSDLKGSHTGLKIKLPNYLYVID